MIASEILDHYREGREEHRLTRALGRLEFLRTWEIAMRYLPPPPARILDVGGGAGIYALALAAQGYAVDLVDPVPCHVERARELSAGAPSPLVSAELGDARTLAAADGSFDAVLMFGPLYHLVARRERVAALREARRVVVNNGVVLSAYISRFAAACDGIQEGMLREADFFVMVDRELDTGVHHPPPERQDWFTTAYFHRPEEIAPEIVDAGLAFDTLIAVEGPGWVNENLDAWLDNEAERERLLHVLRRLETEPALMGASAHLIAVVRPRIGSE